MKCNYIMLLVFSSSCALSEQISIDQKKPAGVLIGSLFTTEKKKSNLTKIVGSEIDNCFIATNGKLDYLVENNIISTAVHFNPKFKFTLNNIGLGDTEKKIYSKYAKLKPEIQINDEDNRYRNIIYWNDKSKKSGVAFELFDGKVTKVKIGGIVYSGRLITGSCI